MQGEDLINEARQTKQQLLGHMVDPFNLSTNSPLSSSERYGREHLEPHPESPITRIWSPYYLLLKLPRCRTKYEGVRLPIDFYCRFPSLSRESVFARIKCGTGSSLVFLQSGSPRLDDTAYEFSDDSPALSRNVPFLPVSPPDGFICWSECPSPGAALPLFLSLRTAPGTQSRGPASPSGPVRAPRPPSRPFSPPCTPPEPPSTRNGRTLQSHSWKPTTVLWWKSESDLIFRDPFPLFPRDACF